MQALFIQGVGDARLQRSLLKLTILTKEGFKKVEDKIESLEDKIASLERMQGDTVEDRVRVEVVRLVCVDHLGLRQ